MFFEVQGYATLSSPTECCSLTHVHLRSSVNTVALIQKMCLLANFLFRLGLASSRIANAGSGESALRDGLKLQANWLIP